MSFQREAYRDMIKSDGVYHGLDDMEDDFGMGDPGEYWYSLDHAYMQTHPRCRVFFTFTNSSTT
jgi:hypothetical protein